jgi:hypothetical protein
MSTYISQPKTNSCTAGIVYIGISLIMVAIILFRNYTKEKRIFKIINFSYALTLLSSVLIGALIVFAFCKYNDMVAWGVAGIFVLFMVSYLFFI